MDDSPTCINSLFHNLVQTPRALLNKYMLPPDGGAAITHAISVRIAAAVSDGSYDDSRQAGSSAFINAPNKDEGSDCLEGMNL